MLPVPDDGIRRTCHVRDKILVGGLSVPPRPGCARTTLRLRGGVGPKALRIGSAATAASRIPFRCWWSDEGAVFDFPGISVIDGGFPAGESFAIEDGGEAFFGIGGG